MVSPPSGRIRDETLSHGTRACPGSALSCASRASPACVERVQSSQACAGCVDLPAHEARAGEGYFRETGRERQLTPLACLRCAMQSSCAHCATALLPDSHPRCDSRAAHILRRRPLQRDRGRTDDNRGLAYRRKSRRPPGHRPSILCVLTINPIQGRVILGSVRLIYFPTSLVVPSRRASMSPLRAP